MLHNLNFDTWLVAGTCAGSCSSSVMLHAVTSALMSTIFSPLQTKVACGYHRLCCLATDDELSQAQSASCMCHFCVAKMKGLLTSSGLPSMLGYLPCLRFICCVSTLASYQKYYTFLIFSLCSVSVAHVMHVIQQQPCKASHAFPSSCC